MITIDELGNLNLPCGSTAMYDGNVSHRCTDCNAVIGSIGMPKHCKELFDAEVEKERIWKVLSR